MRLTLEKVLVLKNIPAFEHVSESALSDFIYACEEVAYAAGKEIVARGSVNDSLFIILHGMVQIKEGETVVSELETRQMFGELTALNPSVVEVSVYAKEETIALKMNSERLYEIMSLHPSITKGIIKVLVSRLQLLDNRHI